MVTKTEGRRLVGVGGREGSADTETKPREAAQIYGRKRAKTVTHASFVTRCHTSTPVPGQTSSPFTFLSQTSCNGSCLCQHVSFASRLFSVFNLLHSITLKKKKAQLSA